MSARPDPLVDRFGRVHSDLRLSLTDRCNLRCSYCMPAEGLAWLPRAKLLTDDEIVRVVEIAAHRLGITTVRLTGGEPLLRPGLPGLIARLSAVDPTLELSITTNGIGLARTATALREAGLRRVNVSLDTLSRDRYAEITRRDRIRDVLAGLQAARAAGLDPVKINTVPVRGVNDDEIPDLAGFAVEHGYRLRFIESMPLDAQRAWERDRMISAEEILGRLRERYELADRSRGQSTGRGVAHRRHRRPGRHHRQRHPGVLRQLRSGPAHRGRPAAQLPVRHQRVRPARPAARRRRRRGGRLARVDRGQGPWPRDQQRRLPPARAADVSHRWLNRPWSPACRRKGCCP